MSKSGNNFYYIQDELGSPMYMTGTDGAVVSSYAFDDFGRNINPFTGNIRNNNSKHAYTKQGNIIQPFAFTGYQEDEVSGLKFAQARYYSAEKGRFQSEDNVKGFIISPFTLNHYGYCFGNPIVLVDYDGNWPEWATKAANAVSGFYEDHKVIINAVVITTAAVGLTVATAGTGAGAAVLAFSTVGGLSGGIMAQKENTSIEEGIARGMADAAVVGTAFTANPIGTIYGLGGQIFTDIINDEISSPETYAAAAVGGAISNGSGKILGKFGNSIGGGTASLTNDILTNALAGGNISGEDMAINAAASVGVGFAFDIGKYAFGNLKPDYVKRGIEYVRNPLSYRSVVDNRSVWNVADDFGRALLGVNGGSDIIQNYLDVFSTDFVVNRWLKDDISMAGSKLECGE